MKIIGIAGGSGSGKSAVSYALVDAEPATFEVLNFDDYQKIRTDPDLPMLERMINWDHPDAIRWDDLLADLAKLQVGQPVTINTFAHRSNPDYAEHRRMISRTIEPKPILIVEGYLALHNPELNQLFDKKYYLELDDETRASRRDKDRLIADGGYQEKVLKPMYEKYILPTRENADVVIEVSGRSVEEVSQRILEIVK